MIDFCAVRGGGAGWRQAAAPPLPSSPKTRRRRPLTCTLFSPTFRDFFLVYLCLFVLLLLLVGFCCSLFFPSVPPHIFEPFCPPLPLFSSHLHQQCGRRGCGACASCQASPSPRRCPAHRRPPAVPLSSMNSPLPPLPSQKRLPAAREASAPHPTLPPSLLKFSFHSIFCGPPSPGL